MSKQKLGNDDSAAGAQVGRAVCYRCDKPRALCICARIATVRNQTGVFVLQHPRERSHPIGTARLLRLGLENVRVDVAWDARAVEDEPPGTLPEDIALLYPSPAARDLATLPPSERPKNLLVLDGTWHTARSLYRDKRWLRALPHVVISPAAESRYRLRKQPAAHCLSSLEAVVQALGALEPETAGLPELIAAFDSMIDDQLAHVRRGVGRLHTRKRRPASQLRIPEALVRDIARMVVVYIESVRHGATGARRLAQFSAARLCDGELLDTTVRAPEGAPASRLLEYMDLTANDFLEAIEPADLAPAFARFTGALAPSPVLVAWNQNTLDLLAASGISTATSVCLKCVYRARFGSEHTTLDAVLEGAQLSAPSLPIRGRAATRLAAAAAVTRYLHELSAGLAR